MRYPANETADKHDRILNEAASLFRERGFAGAGVSEIMKGAGMTHGAFYAHFQSKDDLVADAVERAFDQSEKWMFERTNGGGNAKQFFLEAYLSPKHRDVPGKGCPIAALGTDVGRQPAARRTFTEKIKRTISHMTDRFGKKDSDIDRSDSIHLLCASVGALILARAVDDADLSNEILDRVRDHLNKS